MALELAAKITERRKKKGYNKSQLAHELGISATAVGQFEKGSNNPKTEVLLKMNKVLEYDFINDKPLILNEPDLEYRSKGTSVPIYDIEFAAGIMTSLIESREDHYPVGYLSIPEVTGCDAIIRAKGDSMADRINDRDWIGIKKVENWQEWLPMNYIYAIITDHVELIKYLKKGDTEETFKIVSHNSFYEDDEIPKRLINEIWSVKAVFPFSKIETFI